MVQLIILYKWILYLSFSASVLILFVLFIRKLLKKKIKLQTQYAIGLLIIIRMVIPVLPQSSLSIFNALPFFVNRPPVVSVIDNAKYNQYLTESFNEKSTVDIDGNKNYSYLAANTIDAKINLESIIKLTSRIWALGAGLGLMYMNIAYILCLKKINKYKLIEDKNIVDILQKCKSDMDIKKNIDIVKSSDIKGPAIFSIIKPKILMPLDVIQNMSDNDIKNIFFHELSHYKRKDMLINYILNIISVIHWFNPIIKYFVKEMKKDIELACDYSALSYVECNKIEEYGHTMIDVIKYSKPNNQKPLNMIVGISTDARDMARRIGVIKQFNRDTNKRIASLVIILLFSLIMLTEAKINNVFSEYEFTNKITSKYVVDEFGRNRIIDNTHYPYEYDSEVIGSWKYVDLVNYISDFKRDEKSWNYDFFIKELDFFHDGTTNYKWLTWTKGIAIDKEDKLSSQYFIKDIDGEKYMFFQWKGGDYAYGCRRPMYCVLKKE